MQLLWGLASSVLGQAQLAHCVSWLDLIDDWRNGVTVSGKLDCSQGVGKHVGSYCTNGSCHGQGADCGQDQDCDHDYEHGQNCGN